MCKYLIFLFLLVSFKAQAQYIISGKVVDDKTKKNIPAVSIYINNTTVGTLTDENGSFKIYTPSAGKIELVFSHVSYKKKIVVKEVENNVDIKVELLVANNILNEVVIRGNKDSKAVRKKWIDIFTRNLIGNYPIVSLRCKIKNPEVLYFNYERNEGRLEVFATKPILIENTALGYLVKLDLDEFVYTFKTNDIVFKYSVFFEKIELSKSKEELAERNRSKLYFGSNMHFMRSLYQESLEQNGFSILKFNSISNLEKIRVLKNVQHKIEDSYANKTYPSFNISELISNSDTLEYYKEILNQKNYLSFDTVRLIPSDLTKKLSYPKFINFYSPDTLMIVYQALDPKKNNKLVEVKKYERNGNGGLDLKIYEELTVNYLYWNSYIIFFDEGGINIQENGFYPDMGIYTYGDMNERRLAGMLPFDYYPETDL